MNRTILLALPTLLTAALAAAQDPPGTPPARTGSDALLLLVEGNLDRVDVTSAWRKPGTWQAEHVPQPTGWLRVYDAAGNELAKVHFDLTWVNLDRGATKGQRIVRGDTLFEGRICQLVKIPDFGDRIARLDFESIEKDGVHKLGSVSGSTLLRVLNATALFQPVALPTVRTHINNGPVGNRYDIVVLADGYTAAQEATFVADVNKWTANLFAKEPFLTYAKFFNVHSVFQASNQSGADHPAPCYATPVVRDTIYDAKYCTGGTQRCVYINQTTLASQHAALAPDVEGRIAVFVNDPEYGGCASTFAVSYNGGSGASSGAEVQSHEFGHSYGGLADEYGGDPGCYAGGEPGAPNVTKDSTAAKWSLWKGFNGVGAVEGGQYYDKCIYRPKTDCLMRNLGIVLCEPCKEQLVLQGYVTVNPIENATPASPVTVTKPAVQAFSFSNLVPAASNPLIRWYVDNALQQTGGTSYNFNSASWSAGAHTLRLEVFDQTAMVRKDTANRRTRTHSWTINVNGAGAYTTYGVGCKGSGTGSSGHVVVPAAYATKWGESGNYYPHGRPNIRYQQVFLGSEVGTNTFLGCAFRFDNSGTGPSATIPISVWLGGTTKTPATLNTATPFAANFDSSPATLVFNGTWNYPASTSVNTDLTSFKPTIPFTTPYYFNAISGRNLLYQIDNTATGPDVFHGFDSTSGANTTRVWATPIAATPTGASTGLGLVMCFIPSGSATHSVVPAAYATQWGPSANYYPHGRPNLRYQQVFLGSEVGSGTYDGCAFRLDDSSTGPGATIPISVWLGGTTRTPATLSSTAAFAANFDSSPAQLVFSGNWSFPPNGPPNNDLGSFQPKIPFTAPYVFTAVSGRNLLFQMDNNGTGPDIVHGFDSVSGANTARCLASPIAATPTYRDAIGLVMCFLKNSPSQVLPRAYTATMGNSSNFFPWGKFDQHYQQIFDQSETTAATWGSLSVRQTNSSGPGGTQSVQISLGYSPHAVNALSSTFANNWVSGTQKVVFNGTINVPTLGGTNTNPAQFATIWPFTIPFVHVPQAGRNVLLDVINSSTTDLAHYWDATSSGSTSRLFATPRTSPTGTLGLGYGVIHRFNSSGGGGGIPVIGNIGVPEIGKSFQITLASAKANALAAVWLGVSQTNIPLPANLAAGCTLYASLEVLPLTARVTDAAGAASVVFAIPNIPALRGVKFYNEWFVVDAGHNNLGLVFSNGGAATIGG